MNSKSHIFSQLLRRIFQKIPPFSQNWKHKSHFSDYIHKTFWQNHSHQNSFICAQNHTMFSEHAHTHAHIHTARINNDTTEHSLYTTSKNRGYAAHKKKINVTFLQFSQKIQWLWWLSAEIRLHSLSLIILLPIFPCILSQCTMIYSQKWPLSYLSMTSKSENVAKPIHLD